MDDFEPQTKQILQVEDEEDPLTERLLYGAQDGDEQEVIEALKDGAHVDAKDWGGSTGANVPPHHSFVPRSLHSNAQGGCQWSPAHCTPAFATQRGAKDVCHQNMRSTPQHRT
jgi:hypothetical protein